MKPTRLDLINLLTLSPDEGDMVIEGNGFDGDEILAGVMVVCEGVGERLGCAPRALEAAFSRGIAAGIALKAGGPYPNSYAPDEAKADLVERMDDWKTNG